MAKRGRRPADIIVRDGPISEGLREAVKVRGISKYALARDAGISKPQLYRFLKGERDLSQGGLNSLASKLGVRIVLLRDESPGRTESRDSVVSPATDTEVESASGQTAVPDRLLKLLGDLE
jgi:transcriptional regulator with XRE-family HTH domain